MTLNIDQILRSAKTDIKSGRAVQARSALLVALERFPANTRLQSALAEVQQAATGLPAQPFGPHHLQHFLAVKDRFGLNLAIEEIAAAVRLNSNHPWAHSILGGVLMEAGLLPAAIKHLGQALKLDPAFREAGVNLALAQQQAGLLPQALATVDHVLTRDAQFTPAQRLRPMLLTQLQRDAEAIAAFAPYLAAHPEDLEARITYASSLTMLHRLPEARLVLEAVLKDAPEHAAALGNLGNILLSDGDIAGAEALFLRALAINPRSTIAFFNLGRAKDFAFGDPLVMRMQDLADTATLAPDEAIALHFGLAKAYEDQGAAEASFAHLQKANALRAAQFPYDLATDRALFADYLSRFAPAAPALTPPPAPRIPIFVLGMMRSGTTLTEQILSAHPLVHGAGELEILPQLVTVETARAKGPLDAAALGRIRDAYLAALDEGAGEARYVVDKLPANFRLIGLIQKALPEARILHMRRDPVAVCWSVYKTMFTNNSIGYANSLSDTIGYYDLYAQMMADWRSAYPEGFLDVDYEALTRDPEPAIRRLLDYCGLPFDAACLAPQDNQRAVRTASLRQVRSGIYQGSSGKWRAFAPFLTELTDHFAAR
jgi:tetratricopeptide (TPR) repeat protein